MASIAVDDHRYENVLIIMSKHPFDRIDCETHAMHKAQRVGDAGNDVGSSPSLLGVAAPDPSGLLVGGEPSDSEDALEEELSLRRVIPRRQGRTAVPDTVQEVVNRSGEAERLRRRR